MRIIILAAGKGERLLPLTRNTPKPLLDMGNGRTLLEEQLRSLKDSGVVDDIVLVIGYLASQIEAKMELYQREGVSVRTVFNPFFGSSNNLMSLWLARHEMDDDFMVTNGDNLFASSVFERFETEAPAGISLACGPKRDFDFDDMRVHLIDGQVACVSKKLDDAESDAESPGLCTVRGERARTTFKQTLDKLARREPSLNAFWLETFNELYRSGVSVTPWMFEASKLWQEVDFHGDVEALKRRLSIRPELAGGN